MKKILAVFVALVLVFALCAMPASAETKPSEWKKGTGPVSIDFSDEGTKVIIDEGVNLYYYQNSINIKDFTVKVKFNAPVQSGGYFAFVIGGNGKHTNAQSAQNFVVMWLRDDVLCIDPQVLHNGKSTIIPASRNLRVDISQGDILFHFKQVDDLTYSVEVEEQGFYYEYSIPEAFNWCEDLNGEGCLGFGGAIGAAQVEEYGAGAYSVLVKEINGVKMNGNDPVSSDTSSGGNSATGDSNIDPDTGLNIGIIGGDDTADDATTEEVNEESGISILMVAIICGGVLLLSAAVIAIIVLAVKLKRATAPAEEVSEEVSEETPEE